MGGKRKKTTTKDASSSESKTSPKKREAKADQKKANVQEQLSSNVAQKRVQPARDQKNFANIIMKDITTFEEDIKLPEQKEEPEFVPELNQRDTGQPEKTKSIRFQIEQSLEQLIIKLSKNFALEFKQLDFVKEGWYNNKRASQKNTSKGFKVPEIEKPDEIMIQLLSSFVDQDHQAFIGQILKEHLPNQLQTHYANKVLERFFKDIKSLHNIEELAGLLQKAPPQIRLKATARALALNSKNNVDHDFNISWFQHCIKPAMAASVAANFQQFSQNEIKQINDLVEQAGPSHFTDDEAIQYLHLLKHGGLLSLDKTIHYFSNREGFFWISFLTEVCQINKEMAQIWYEDKEVMISDAVFKHYKKLSMSISFAETIAKFQKLSPEDLSSLYQLSSLRNFSNITSYLDKSIKHDFGLFKTQSETFLKLSNSGQLEACSILAKVPLENWHNYTNQIFASSCFFDSAESRNKVFSAIEGETSYKGIPSIQKEELERLESQWKIAFDNLNQKIIVHEWAWQKLLTTMIAYIALTCEKRNIFVTLGTGHGKSIVIQILADMIYQIKRARVIVVCLNNFLSHWSRTTYGSQNVLNQEVEYVSMEHFIKRTPDRDAYVIYDEIDQMLGQNSFYLVQQDNLITAKYQPVIMSQWKCIIGFSGTIANPTQTQIRSELKEPVSIVIPSLRKDGAINKITKVVKCTQETLIPSVHTRLNELANSNKNFIVIFKTAKEVEQFTARKNANQVLKNKNLIQLVDFSQNYAQIERNVREAMKDNFIIATTVEGSRGVDYKGLSPAHVIVAFTPENLSQLIQALGRGCRDLTKYAEGTIICQNPLTIKAAEYLDLLQRQDDELAESLQINCKLCRMLHDQTLEKPENQEEIIEKKPNETLILALLFFQSAMKEGKNLIKAAEGQAVWKKLRSLDQSGTMPAEIFDAYKWRM